jgi:hypothetical protein
MGITTEPTLRLTRLRETPKGVPIWIVEGHPFRLVALNSGWLLAPIGGDARRLLVRHDLLAQPLRTRTAALQALRAVLTSRGDGGRRVLAR